MDDLSTSDPAQGSVEVKKQPMQKIQIDPDPEAQAITVNDTINALIDQVNTLQDTVAMLQDSLAQAQQAKTDETANPVVVQVIQEDRNPGAKARHTSMG